MLNLLCQERSCVEDGVGTDLGTRSKDQRVGQNPTSVVLSGKRVVRPRVGQTRTGFRDSTNFIHETSVGLIRSLILYVET